MVTVSPTPAQEYTPVVVVGGPLNNEGTSSNTFLCLCMLSSFSAEFTSLDWPDPALPLCLGLGRIRPASEASITRAFIRMDVRRIHKLTINEIVRILCCHGNSHCLKPLQSWIFTVFFSRVVTNRKNCPCQLTWGLSKY